MAHSVFEKLLRLVERFLTKQSANVREPINPSERLSFISFHLTLFIHEKTFQQIKYETYLLIYNLRIKFYISKKPEVLNS